MLNILALHKVNDLPGVYVQYNGDKEDVLYIIFQTGIVLKLTKIVLGLYIYDTAHLKDYEFITKSLKMLRTVEENEINTSKKELKGAKLAREIQDILC